MPFGDTYIEGPFWHDIHHDVHRTARRHCRCDTYYLWILLCQLQKGMTEHILIFLRFVGVFVDNTFTRLRIELPWCMPCGDVLFCRSVAVAFLSMKMQKLWTFHRLQLSEDTYQFFYVMTIERTEIADVHAIEDVLLVGNGTLDSIRKALDTFLAFIVHHTILVQPTGCLELDGIVCLIGVQSQQILFHTAHRTVYRHIIVVEDD